MGGGGERGCYAAVVVDVCFITRVCVRETLFYNVDLRHTCVCECLCVCGIGS